MESYTRAYPLLVKLHMLRELEDCNPVLATAEVSKQSAAGPSTSPGVLQESALAAGMRDATQDWDDRLKITQPSLWAREPILALRRWVENIFKELRSILSNEKAGGMSVRCSRTQNFREKGFQMKCSVCPLVPNTSRSISARQ